MHNPIEWHGMLLTAEEFIPSLYHCKFLIARKFKIFVNNTNHYKYDYGILSTLEFQPTLSRQGDTVSLVVGHPPNLPLWHMTATTSNSRDMKVPRATGIHGQTMTRKLIHHHPGSYLITTLLKNQQTLGPFCLDGHIYPYYH